MMIAKLLGAMASVSLLTAAAVAQDYPDRDIQGVVQFSAGGGTDTYARTLQPFLEDELGQSLIMTNRTGANGVIGMQYTLTQPSDGYTLLFASEAPQSYKVLGLSEYDLTDFVPINISSRGVSVIAVPADSPLETFDDLLAAAAERPGELRMGFLGAGSPGHVVQTMIASETDFEVISVPFDGDGTAMPAMLGGALDFMPLGLSSAQEMIVAGRMRALAVINDEAISQLPDVPPITDFLPELERYLPWGTFYGIYVAQDTPEDVQQVLIEAAQSAADNSEFQELIEARGGIMMNAAGQEAADFLASTRSVTSWLLFDGGAAELDPSQFGIERP